METVCKRSMKNIVKKEIELTEEKEKDPRLIVSGGGT